MKTSNLTGMMASPLAAAVSSVLARAKNQDQAARVIHEELQVMQGPRVISSPWISHQDREDQVQRFMLKLMEEAQLPPEERTLSLGRLAQDVEQGAQPESALKGYLHRALKNQALSDLRRNRRWTNFSDLERDNGEGRRGYEPAAGPGQRPANQARSPREKREALEQLQRQALGLLQQILERSAGRSPALARRLLEDLDTACQLCLTDGGMEGLLRQRGLRWGDPACHRAQNQVLQRQSRLRKRLRQAIEAQVTSGELSEAEAAIARRMVEEVMFRRKGAGKRPARAPGETPDAGRVTAARRFAAATAQGRQIRQ